MPVRSVLYIIVESKRTYFLRDENDVFIRCALALALRARQLSMAPRGWRHGTALCVVAPHRPFRTGQHITHTLCRATIHSRHFKRLFQFLARLKQVLGIIRHFCSLFFCFLPRDSLPRGRLRTDSDGSVCLFVIVLFCFECWLWRLMLQLIWSYTE